MKTAENRTIETGKVLRDGAEPLMSEELTGIEPYAGVRTSLFWNFVLPVMIVIGVAMGSFFVTSTALTMEAFLLSAIVAGTVMRVQGIPLSDIMSTAMAGMKGIMPAVLILAFAYAINDLSRSMGTANYIVAQTESWLTPGLLPMLTFLIACIISFATGTSWGTFAIMMPIAVPMAFDIQRQYPGYGGVCNGRGRSWRRCVRRSLLATVGYVYPRLDRCRVRSYRSHQDAAAVCNRGRGRLSCGLPRLGLC